MGCGYSSGSGPAPCLNERQVDAKYDQKRHLDTGTYGTVFLARDKRTSEEVAIKYIPRNQINKYVEAEVLNFSICKHPQVIQFREVFLTPTDLAIVMEYAAGGNLHSYIVSQSKARGGSGLGEKEAKWFFQQLVIGVDYCHKLNIANRDLKLENTLLATGEAKPLVKICDFGLSKKQDAKTVFKTKVGTPGYTAPEILRGHTTYDGTKADIWSLGVILYLLTFGIHPFFADTDPTDDTFPVTTKKILEVDYTFPTDLVSQGLRDLLAKIFVGNPLDRITIAGIFAHPWFKKGLPSSAILADSDKVINQAQQTRAELQKLLRIAKAV